MLLKRSRQETLGIIGAERIPLSKRRTAVWRSDERELVESWEDIKLLRQHADELAWLEACLARRRDRPPVSLQPRLRRLAS